MQNTNEFQVLSGLLNESKAKEILKLTKAYDNYVGKFKEKLNPLLAELDYEIKIGLRFVKKSKGDVDGGSN